MLGPPAVFPGARFRVYVSVGRPIQTNIFTILFNDHRHWHFLEITMPFLNLGDVLRLLQNSKKKAWRHPEGRPLAQEQTRTPRKLPLKKLNKSSAIVHNHASNVPPPPCTESSVFSTSVYSVHNMYSILWGGGSLDPVHQRQGGGTSQFNSYWVKLIHIPPRLTKIWELFGKQHMLEIWNFLGQSP